MVGWKVRIAAEAEPSTYAWANLALIRLCNCWGPKSTQERLSA